VITDNDNLSDKSKNTYETVKIEDLNISWPTAFEITDRRINFRDNFWFSTKARLFLIPKLMEYFKLEKVLHIENDVWIHPEFPFQLLSNLRHALAYPRVDEFRGVASILLINGESGGKLLTDACIRWPDMTDMQILGQLWVNQQDVYALPSTFGNGNNVLDNWIFDGAKIGMYLFGSDPKNTLGVIKRFNKSPMGDLDSPLGIQSYKETVWLINQGTFKRVANLHLHSKTVGMYSKNWLLILNRQLTKNKMNLSYSFSPHAFLFSIHELTYRILRKIKAKGKIKSDSL
jgi:hypothetical protein